MSTFKHLNDDQLDEIVQLATDFQVTNGSIKKTKDEEKGSGHSLIPFLLLPMPISGKHFELAKSLQTKYQVLSVYPTLFFFNNLFSSSSCSKSFFAEMSFDNIGLRDCFASSIKQNQLMSRLWKLWTEVIEIFIR